MVCISDLRGFCRDGGVRWHHRWRGRQDVGQETREEPLDAFVRGSPEPRLTVITGIVAADRRRDERPCRVHHQYDVLQGLGDGLMLQMGGEGARYGSRSAHSPVGRGDRCS